MPAAGFTKDTQEEEKKQALAPSAPSILDTAKPATAGVEGAAPAGEAEKLRAEQAEKEKAFASKPLEYVT